MLYIVTFFKLYFFSLRFKNVNESVWYFVNLETPGIAGTTLNRSSVANYQIGDDEQIESIEYFVDQGPRGPHKLLGPSDQYVFSFYTTNIFNTYSRNTVIRAYSANQ